MKTIQLTAILAAAALTLASLSAVDYNAPVAQAPETAALHVTNLAPVLVYPAAAERHAVAMETRIDAARIILAAAPRAERSHADPALPSVAPQVALQ